MRGPFRTIRAQIVGMILVGATVALLVAGALLSLAQYRTLQSYALQQAGALAKMVAANTAAAISFRDERAAAATLATLAEQESVRFACILLPSGEIFARWPVGTDVARDLPPGSAAWLKAQIASRPEGPIGMITSDDVDVIAPVLIDSEVIALVHVSADTGQLRKQLVAYRTYAGSAGILALMIVAVLSWLLHRAITGRIAAVIGAMAEVRRSGNHRVRLPADGRDEIADLAGGFNAMLAELSLRDDQLAAYRRDLERQVEDRTAALKEANATLERSNRDLQSAQVENRRLALVAQSTGSAVIVCGGDGRVRWVNEAFTRMTGHQLGAIVGKRPIDFLFGPETEPAAIEAMQSAQQRREAFTGEVASYTRARQPIWLSVNIVPVLDPAGTVEQIVTVAVDVSAMRRQEQRLAEALEREREVVAQQKRFIAVAAHEFRTPLTIIDGAAQRLARYAEATTPGDLRERMDRIRRAVARMGQLIDTTLNSARLDAGRIEMNPTELDLVPVVRGCAQRLGTVAAGFDLRMTGDWQSLPVRGDKRLLEQVFTNLLSNAVKYSGESRAIDVALARTADRVRVDIRDYGIGVPEDEIAKLFTRFYRASTAKGLPGTGIGLNLVKELVELHDGEVEVTSRVGEGSCFSVSLPLSRGDGGAAGEIAQTA
jgi:PAS domain S-box-containing protein